MNQRNVRNLMADQQLEAPVSRGAHRKPKPRTAPTRTASARTASARTAPGRTASAFAFAAAGIVALGVSLGAAPAQAATGTGAAPAATVGDPSSDNPPRVTGFSNFFDYCQTGSTLAIPLFYGIGTSTLNLAISQFPAGAQPVTNQVLVAEAAGPQLFEQMAGPSTQFIEGGRTAVAPLAAYNGQFNEGLHAMAEGTRTAAKDFGPLVQPGDVSMYQFADFLDSLQAK